MPEAKPGQLQQAPALLLAAPLQRPDSHMLAESTLSNTPPIPPCSGASQTLKSCKLLPPTLVSSLLDQLAFKSSLQKGLALVSLLSLQTLVFLDLGKTSYMCSEPSPLALCSSPQLNCEVLQVEPCSVSDAVVP